MEQLTSDSVLLVRRHDVVSRFRDWCPLNEILKQRDSRWRTMNVIGKYWNWCWNYFFGILMTEL